MGLRRVKGKVNHPCCGHSAHPGFHQPEVVKVATLQVAVTKVPEGHLTQKLECTCCPSSWRTGLRRRQHFSMWSQPLAAPGTGPRDRVHTGSCSGACAPRPQVCVAPSSQGSQPHSRGLQYLLAHTRSSPAGCTRGHREAGAAPQVPCPPAPRHCSRNTAGACALASLPWGPSRTSSLSSFSQYLL